MKFFLAITLIATIVSFVASATVPSTDEQKAKAKEHIAACIKETGTTPESAKKLQDGVFNANDDEKVKCFTKCFMEKAGFMDSHGKLQDAVIIEKLSKANDKDKVTAVLNQCKQQTGKTQCEQAYNIYKCAIHATTATDKVSTTTATASTAAKKH